MARATLTKGTQKGDEGEHGRPQQDAVLPRKHLRVLVANVKHGLVGNRGKDTRDFGSCHLQHNDDTQSCA